MKSELGIRVAQSPNQVSESISKLESPGATEHHSLKQNRKCGKFSFETKGLKLKRHPGIGRPCPQCNRSKPYCDSNSLKAHLRRSCPKGIVTDESELQELCIQSRNMARIQSMENNSTMEKDEKPEHSIVISTN